MASPASFLSYVSPFSKAHGSTWYEFKSNLTTWKKIVVVAASLFATLVTLPLFGLGGLATFRVLVGRLKKIEVTKQQRVDPTLFNSNVSTGKESGKTTESETKIEESTHSQTKLNQPGAEKPYSQLGKEAIEFARNKLKEMSPKIENFKPHLFVKSSSSRVEEVLLQPANQEIAELYSLYESYNRKIQERLRYCQNNHISPWEEQEVIGIVSRYMKVCYAISCLSLEDLVASTKKEDRRTYAQALMSEDSYFLQTFNLIYDKFTSLHCGTFWREDYHWSETSNIIDEFKKTPSYKEAFYKEGTDQNSWRLLSNDFCNRLSLYTSSSDLFDAGSADSNSESWRGKSQMYRHDDKDTLNLFSYKA